MLPSKHHLHLRPPVADKEQPKKNHDSPVRSGSGGTEQTTEPTVGNPILGGTPPSSSSSRSKSKTVLLAAGTTCVPGGSVHRFFGGCAGLVAYMFSFLDLRSHFSLARTSVVLLGRSKQAMASWRKPARLPCAITDENLQSLCSYASLTSLDLSYCVNITDGGLLHLKALPLKLLD